MPICPYCSQPFESTREQRKHIRYVHQGANIYICPTCYRSFAFVHSLRIHTRLHTGEKPHVCPACSERFTRADTLTIHIRTHTGERPYVCCVCSAAYAQLSPLTSHLRNRHPDQYRINQEIKAYANKAENRFCFPAHANHFLTQICTPPGPPVTCPHCFMSVPDLTVHTPSCPCRPYPPGNAVCPYCHLHVADPAMHMASCPGRPGPSWQS